MQSSIEQLVQQRLMDMIGKEILLRIVEVDKKSRHLKLSQRLHANNKPVSEELEIGSIHTGIIVSISAAFVTVDLGGIRGKLFSKQPTPDQSKFIDLSTTLRLGQAIKVIIIQKEKNVCFL